jgi:hypothetical protein
MSNLNKFHDSYQVLKKSKALSLEKKKSSRIHKECLNKLFLPKILTANTFDTNVHKMHECDKNQVRFCNVKSFQSEVFGNFGPLIEHGPHWINFIILTFRSWFA